MQQTIDISVSVNGERHEGAVEPRLLLSDFLRHELGLTGTRVGCEHGVCGACTVLLEGEAVRSCLLFAVQADGHALTTVEGLAPARASAASAGDGPDPAGESALHPLQAAFREAHGLQCGFCTAGILMTMIPFLEENPSPTRREIREALGGNLCRCTGYHNIVDAVELAAKRMTRTGGGSAAGAAASDGRDPGGPDAAAPAARSPGSTAPVDASTGPADASTGPADASTGPADGPPGAAHGSGDRGDAAPEARP